MDTIETFPTINLNYLVIEVIMLFFSLEQIPGNIFKACCYYRETSFYS